MAPTRALLLVSTLSRHAWGVPFMPRKPLEAFKRGGRLVKVGAKPIQRGKSAPSGAPNGLARQRSAFSWLRAAPPPFLPAGRSEFAGLALAAGEGSGLTCLPLFINIAPRPA
jgi:hypothetical protein